jgi:GNAT superfamily N-acetyltransferase
VSCFHSAYLKEREDVDTLEHEFGFSTFRFRDHDCYILDVYVVPEKRKLGIAAEMADAIAALAKSRGLSTLTGSVDSRANGAEASAAILTAYGMTVVNTDGPVTYFAKRI